MQEFIYEAPTSVAQAVTLLKRLGEKARPICGGTDIMIQMRAGVRRPDCLIDVKQIKDLRQIKFDSKSGARLGAAVPCIEVYESEALRKHYPGLTEAAHLIGSLQIQNRASVGGNLCNGSPAADTTPALIALGAKAKIAGKGTRQVPVEEFVISPGRTVLKPGELLVEFLIPAPKPHSSDSYLRFIPRNEMDIAIVNAAAYVELDESRNRITSARLALGAVAPTPLFLEEAAEALRGAEANEETYLKAGEAAAEAARPIADMRGGIAQRRHLSKIMIKRALEGAVARARNN